ncbi:type VII secretion protein EccB [Kitasatospora sp. NBC_01246]|uniref:type VII secretion protein EccB n=1 Tax=Kitasatospora sp. NBC_01246 TaxID=2903570 RepID=UPI002E380441|nr:type VII secretion protein EccB [Kitasatospora sp. NBC_01246]
MASRRDELNAYTFARKRTVGAFLLPNGGGSDEDAPRPVKAILPSVIVGALVVGAFGVWGVFKPSAPVGWDSGKNIVQGKKSTTRYVVLTDPDGKTKRLHQVLNMSSARLVLPVDAKVVVVADEVLDKYPSHGPTIGIPNAPDRLPTRENASKPMKWSVCDSPGPDDKQETANQALFLAGGADAKTLAAKDRVLDTDQALLVKEIDDQQVAAQPGPGQPPIDQSKLNLYLIDSQGRKHAIGGTQTSESDKKQLMAAIFGASAKPQPVKREWMDTLVTGSVIQFPKIDGLVPDVKGPNSSVALQKPEDRKIGRLVRYGDRNFVVGKDQLFVVTQLQAELIRQNPAWQGLYNQDADRTPRIDELMPADYAAFNSSTPLKDADDWPTRTGAPANNWQAAKDAKPVICSTFDGMAEDGKTPRRSVWAGPDFPAKHSSGVGSAYVTPGQGLFYRALDGGAGGSGSDYLITETGLRYAVPANTTGGKGAQAAPSAQPGKPVPTVTATPTVQPGDPAAGQPGQQQDEAGGNQARLGYQGLQPVPVPLAWSALVPSGPALNAKTAAQQQNA